MKIHRGQKQVFRDAAARRFVEELVVHVRRHFPSRCSSLGEAGTREAVDAAVRRGVEHGFRSRRELCKYTNLVFTFNASFDTVLPWARVVLGDATIDDPERRMDALMAAAFGALSG